MARDPKPEATIAELSAQLDTLKAELAELAAEAKDRGADIAEEAADRGRAAYRRLRHEARVRAEHARDLGQDYLGRAEGALRDHPATAMGAAVGVGFLIGLLLARR